MKIHLLEPHRKYLIAQALSEDLIKFVSSSPITIDTNKFSIWQERMAGTLQLAVLADDISISWIEDSEVEQQRNLPYIIDSGLKSIGVVTLLDEKSRPSEYNEKWRQATIEELWMIEKEIIDTYEELLLSQLKARGTPIHYSIFRLLRAVRLGETAGIPIILNVVPRPLYALAKMILEQNPQIRISLDDPIITMASELRIIFDSILTSDYRAAGAAIDHLTVEDSHAIQDASKQLWMLVVETLIGEEIAFPVPGTLREVVDMRNKAGIREFRELLVPMLDSVVQGHPDVFTRLRREVKIVAKHLRRFPKVKRLSGWTTYASIGAGVVEAFIGLIGPSIALGISALGLERISKSWERSSRWLYLAQKSE